MFQLAMVIDSVQSPNVTSPSATRTSHNEANPTIRFFMVITRVNLAAIEGVRLRESPTEGH